MEKSFSEKKIGQILGFIAVIITIVAGTCITISGYPWVGGGLLTGSLLGLAGAFILEKKQSIVNT